MKLYSYNGKIITASSKEEAIKQVVAKSELNLKDWRSCYEAAKKGNKAVLKASPKILYTAAMGGSVIDTLIRALAEKKKSLKDLLNLPEKYLFEFRGRYSGTAIGEIALYADEDVASRMIKKFSGEKLAKAGCLLWFAYHGYNCIFDINQEILTEKGLGYDGTVWLGRFATLLHLYAVHAPKNSTKLLKMPASALSMNDGRGNNVVKLWVSQYPNKSVLLKILDKIPLDVLTARTSTTKSAMDVIIDIFGGVSKLPEKTRKELKKIHYWYRESGN